MCVQVLFVAPFRLYILSCFYVFTASTNRARVRVSVRLHNNTQTPKCRGDTLRTESKGGGSGGLRVLPYIYVYTHARTHYRIYAYTHARTHARCARTRHTHFKKLHINTKCMDTDKSRSYSKNVVIKNDKYYGRPRI
jgi:hypothetical protein